MIVREPESNPEAPLLGKEGVVLLELWKAQMAWLATTGQLVPVPPAPDTDKVSVDSAE